MIFLFSTTLTTNPLKCQYTKGLRTVEDTFYPTLTLTTPYTHPQLNELEVATQ